jgi:4-azaleucine resistance transporter AzlC
MFDDPSFRRGAAESWMLFFTTGAFGVLYGVLAIEAGFGALLTIFSSVVIVSGAAQFTMIGLLAAGPLPVLLSAVGLGLRHIPMSATMAAMMGPRPLWTRVRMAWVLVDESYGLAVRAHRAGVADIVAYKTAADLLLYSGWVAGTVVGALFGARIDPAAAGVAVFFPLLFLGLAAPMIRTRREAVVGALTVVTTLLAVVVLPPAWQLTVAAAVAAGLGALVDG